MIVISRTRHKRCNFRRGFSHSNGGRANATLLVQHTLPGTAFVNFANAPVSVRSHSAHRMFNSCVSICSVARTMRSSTAHPMFCRDHIITLGLSRNVLTGISSRCRELARRTGTRAVSTDGHSFTGLSTILNTPRIVSTLYRSVIRRCRTGHTGRLANGTVVITCSHPTTVTVCRQIYRLHPS